MSDISVEGSQEVLTLLGQRTPKHPLTLVGVRLDADHGYVLRTVEAPSTCPPPDQASFTEGRMATWLSGPLAQTRSIFLLLHLLLLATVTSPWN